MFVRYGTFDFQPWEAALSVHAKFMRSPRGFKEFQNVYFNISGSVVGPDQYAINTRLNQIFTAFSVDGRSCGLMKDDNTPSVHWMNNTATDPLNLTDVQVVDMRLPETTNGEFCFWPSLRTWRLQPNPK